MKEIKRPTDKSFEEEIKEAKKRVEERMSKPMSPQEQKAEDRIQAIIEREGHIGRETVDKIVIEEGLPPLPSLD